MNGLAAGRDFLDALIAAGVVPPETRRVVIDAGMAGPVLLYVETWASDGLLRVESQAALRGATVKVIAVAPPAAVPLGEATASTGTAIGAPPVAQEGAG